MVGAVKVKCPHMRSEGWSPYNICHRTVMVAAPTRNRRVGREVHVGSSPTDGAILKKVSDNNDAQHSDWYSSCRPVDTYIQ